jgi:hypothetical protein
MGCSLVDVQRRFRGTCNPHIDVDVKNVSDSFCLKITNNITF